MRRALVPLMACALAWAACAVSRAEDFYRGKSINFVVGFGAGAGMDTTARTIARHLPRFIPGAPNILVQQMEGAAGLIAAFLVSRLRSSRRSGLAPTPPNARWCAAACRWAASA